MKKHTNELKCKCGRVHQWNYDSTRQEPKHKTSLGGGKSIVAADVRVRTCECGAILQLQNEKTIRAISNGCGTSILVED